MLGWCGGVLMLAEARQWRESRLVTASSQVKRWPGLYASVIGFAAPSVRSPPGKRCLRDRRALRLGEFVARGRPDHLRRAVPPRRATTRRDDLFPAIARRWVNFACRAGGGSPARSWLTSSVEPGHFAQSGLSLVAWARCIWSEEQVAVTSEDPSEASAGEDSACFLAHHACTIGPFGPRTNVAF